MTVQTSPRWDNLRKAAREALTLHLALKVALGFLTSVAMGYFSVVWYCLAEGVPVFDMLEATGSGVFLISSLAWLVLLAIALILLVPGMARLLDPGHHHPDPNAEAKVVEWRNHFRWLLAVVPGAVAYSCIVMPMFIAATDHPGAKTWMDFARLGYVLLVCVALFNSANSVRRSAGSRGIWREVRTGCGYLLGMNAVTMFSMFIYTQVAIELLSGFYRSSPNWGDIPTKLLLAGLPILPGILLVFLSGWAVRRRAGDVVLAVIGVTLCCVFFWPTAPHVVERMLNFFSIGGGRVVALWVDNGAVCLRLPDLLSAGACPPGTQDPDRIRLKPLPLALRGKDAYLLWLDGGPKQPKDGEDARRAMIAIPRADVHEVEYLRDGSDRVEPPSERQAPS